MPNPGSREAEIEIIPAVDIRGGRCVRLYQGDYDQETIFSDDPVGVALRWQSMGAPRLHIVDLDGAATGEPVNMDVIAEIAAAALIPVQLGGGIRKMSVIKKLLSAGVDRVILGTAAAEEPGLIEEACQSFGQSIVVSIDARDGRLATHGWKKDTDIEAAEFARSMAKLGVKRFIYTDIGRDGTLTEPNFSAVYGMISSIQRPVIASGGVTSLNHLKMLKLLGAEGAIIGRALYTRDIRLKQALEVINKL